MEADPRHRALYKTRPAPWKETYRKRCVERLKNSRAKLLDRYRHVGDNPNCSPNGSLLVQEVMEEEWRALKVLDSNFQSLWKKGGLTEVLNPLENINELADFEEIQQELLNEEQAIIEEYEASLCFDEACLNAILDGFDVPDRLICPVCNRNYLIASGDFITCLCGMCINTKEVTVQQFRALLEHSVAEHSTLCASCPSFTVVNGREAEPTLLMSCQACDYLTVVL
ncbi:RPA-interacting protein [Scyliorhinus canicula]|uniref:RPA-interacting protein n=1 Tax=Scyliorhinus canicula TaxID=7830 RepID=UPI0018F76CB7|nr:RPA-interacting protein [Scyliorhinus canicula]